MKKLALLFVVFLILGVSAARAAQTPPEIEIVFDASGSMNDTPRGVSKMEEAKQALSTIAGQIEPGSKVGLRVFGVTPAKEDIRESCSDSKLLIPIGRYDADKMIQEIRPLKSYGMTALGLSLEQAGRDFSQDAGVKKIIILISDGEETCGKDPVGVIDALKQQGIEVTIHAVGFDASGAAKEQMTKLAGMTGGSYREAGNAGELKQSLEQVVEQAKLLTVGRSGEENILSAAAGATIVSSSTQDFAKAIDGDEKDSFSVYPGQEAVFAFRENKPVRLAKFAVPVFEESPYNPGEIALSGSVSSPEKGFFPIGKFKVENKVYFGNVYQEFLLEPAVAIRYLKVTVGAAVSMDHSNHYEWKAYGRFLSDDEFNAEAAKQPKREMNLLASENGGQFIAGSRQEFTRLIDGKGGSTGEAVDFYPNEEAIFAFEDGKKAILTKAAVPIFKAAPTNCKSIEFYASETSPGGPYTKIGSFETTNLVFAGNPFQEYAFETPVKAKYLKIKVIDTHGSNWCTMQEVQAIGSLEG